MQSEPLSFGQVEARNVTRLTGLKCEAEHAKRTPWEQRLARTWGDGNAKEWDVGQPICRGCRTKIDPTPFVREFAGATVTLPITVCDDCMDLARQHYGKSDHGTTAVSLTPKWDEACPPRFKAAIDGQIPANIDRKAFDRVTRWRPADAKGMALRGPSGSGKSTAFWALAKALEREGTAPVVLTAVELGRILATAAREVEAVEWLWRCRVLMVDDLGKERATPAVGSLLWEVLDRRYTHGLPIIVTTRFEGKDLKDRFGEAFLGDDILRRLNDLCTGVIFTLPGQTAPAAA